MGETLKSDPAATEVSAPVGKGMVLSAIGGVMTADVQRVAAWTFAALMVLGGLFLVLGAWVSGTGEAYAWKTTVLIRGAEIISVMAASLLIFIVISARSGDAILSLLGVMVIAAIIVPTQELMRMAGLLGVGEGTNQEASSRTGRGLFVARSQSEIVASRAITELLRHDRAADLLRPVVERRSGERSQVQPRKVLELALAGSLYRYDLEALEMSVRQRGLDRTLLDALEEQRMRQIALTPSQARRTREDLWALRDIGLVSVAPGDLATARATRLGVEVLCRIHPDRPEVKTAAAANGLPEPNRRVAECSWPFDARHTALPQTALTSRTWTRSSRPDLRLRVEVRDPSGAVVDLDIKDDPVSVSIETLSPTARFDPYLELLHDGNVIDSDDDSKGDLNARVVQTLDPGSYKVRLTGVGDSPGSALLEIRAVGAGVLGLLMPMDAERISLNDFPAPKTIEMVAAAGARGFGFEVPRDGAVLSFDVSTAGTYRLDVQGQNNTDLEMALYQRSGNQAERLDGNDDRSAADRSNSLDPLIERQLEPGSYLVRLRDRKGGRTNASIRIDRPAPGETPAVANPAPAPELNTGSPGSVPAPRVESRRFQHPGR